MAYVEDNAVIGKELSDTYFNKGTEEEGKITPKPATTAQKGVVEQATPAEVGAGDSDTLAVNPLGLVGALNDTSTAGGNAVQKGVANALEASIGGDQGAQTALGNALKDNVASAIAADAASMAALAAGFPDAADDKKGKIATASVSETAAGVDTAQALTPGGLAGALSATTPAGGNPQQKAVVNAVEQAIAGDPGAQAAIAAAIADDLGATCAETIEGLVSDRFVSPDDLSCALQKGAAYPINVDAPITAKVVYADMFIGPNTRVNDIGVPGTAGFGQGVCPKPPEGLMPLSNGTYVRGDKDYGNYIDASGSVMVWVPAFYYKITGNLVEIKSVWDYADEAAANAAGFALHRAFYDGTVQPGFFIDKYTCSNSGGVFASVRAGVPVDTDNSQSGVGAITGVGGVNNYGMIQQAAKSRGAAYHSASIFNYKAVALLSLAHASAATSTVYCAWYNPAANFPKGCNSNTLSDVNDTAIKFAPAGHPTYPAKPLAGSGSQFAKTTHNGQESGISDINGTVWNVAFGLTSDGSNYFLLKPTVRMRDLTGSNATAANSFFGAAGRAANYDDVGASIGALIGNSTVKYFGNATQTLGGALNGTGWALTGAGVPIAVGGTNQFGSDYIADYRPNDMCPLVGANWNAGSLAGVWALSLSAVRTSAGGNVGGRAALYL